MHAGEHFDITSTVFDTVNKADITFAILNILTPRSNYMDSDKDLTIVPSS